MTIYLVSSEDNASLESILSYASSHERNISDYAPHLANRLTVIIYEDTRIVGTNKKHHAKSFYDIKAQLCSFKHTQTFLIRNSYALCVLYHENKDAYNPMMATVTPTETGNLTLDFLRTSAITVLNPNGHLNDFFKQSERLFEKTAMTPESTLHKVMVRVRLSYITTEGRYTEQIHIAQLMLNASTRLNRSFAGIPITDEERSLLLQAIAEIKKTSSYYNLMLNHPSLSQNILKCRDDVIRLASVICSDCDAFIIAERQGHLFNSLNDNLTTKQWHIVWEAYDILKSNTEHKELAAAAGDDNDIITAIETLTFTHQDTLVIMACKVVEEYIRKLFLEQPRAQPKAVTLDQKSIMRFFKQNQYTNALSEQDVNSLFDSKSLKLSKIERYYQQSTNSQADTSTRIKSLLKLAAYYRNIRDQNDRPQSPDSVAKIDEIGPRKPKG